MLIHELHERPNVSGSVWPIAWLRPISRQAGLEQGSVMGPHNIEELAYRVADLKKRRLNHYENISGVSSVTSLSHCFVPSHFEGVYISLIKGKNIWVVFLMLLTIFVFA